MQYNSKNNIKKKRGFTLAEIMIVVAIIGLLAVIAVPNFLKARDKARTNICINNQRLIFHAAEMYTMETKSTLEGLSQTGKLDQLLASEYFKDNSGFGCPNSNTLDYDDYILSYSGGILTDIQCQIEPTDHVWP